LRVVLVSASQDQVDFSVSCARSPSFWCKAAEGRSTTLSEQEFLALAEEAAGMLSGIPELESAEGVADAVCRKGSDRERFLRELAALALNLATGLDRGTPLDDEEFQTIGDAFERAVEIAQGTPSPEELDKFKELVEGINDNENTSIPGCDDDGSQDDTKSDDQESDDDDPSSDDNSESESTSGG
jgi:hypothetical protein